MKIDFTKTRWAGMDCILITIREKSREPVLILDKSDIERLNGEWNKEQLKHSTPLDVQERKRKAKEKGR